MRLSKILSNAGYYDFYSHSNTPDYNIKLAYNQFSPTIEGSIELYGVFFFELSKQLNLLKVGKDRLIFLR